MPKIEIEISEYKNGDIVLDLTTLPAKSVSALLRRGLTHFFGSEMASKVKAVKDRHLADTKEELGEADVAAVKAEFIRKGVEALLSGTIGERAVGQTVDPVEVEMERIAKREVREICKLHNVTIGKDGVATFAGGQTKTLDEMVAKRIDTNRERLTKEAKAVIKAKESKKAAIASEVQGGDAVDADALGL